VLALILHGEARRPARRGTDGRYIPLSGQDPNRWSVPLIEETERHLSEAFKLGRSGRFQLEAAIQSVHAELARTGRTDWTAIALFYERLTRLSPASEQPQLLKQRDLKRGWPFSSRLTATPLRTISRIGPFALTSFSVLGKRVRPQTPRPSDRSGGRSRSERVPAPKARLILSVSEICRPVFRTLSKSVL